MASLGEVIYEDFLYKLNQRSNPFSFGKSHPWKQKYFILKRLGNRPLLEYFNKKPKFKQAVPKGKLELWPSFRVEKIANMKNRAYVFQISTPDETICLSADEQRVTDLFVFFLQIQSRLKDQIRDCLFPVKPENSEAQRRIGAKGANCLLHVSEFGVTLVLQSNRAVLAQWPLKSIRCYESSESGQLSIEAGRIAPMGDGLYIFQTANGANNQIYDLLDNFVLETLNRTQPGQRGDMEEIGDYLVEAVSLLDLTTVSACNGDSPDIRNLLQSNWNIDLPVRTAPRARHFVHTRLTASGSTASINSQNSHASNLQATTSFSSGARNSPQSSRSLPVTPGNPIEPCPLAMPTDAMAARPPAPPPSSSIPVKGANRGQAKDQYLHMNAFSRSDSNPSPFMPTSDDWQSPPSFREVMREAGVASFSDSYIHPSPGTVTSTPNHGGPNTYTVGHQYLTPLTTGDDEHEIIAGNVGAANQIINDTSASSSATSSPIKRRLHRLRSASCEDLSDYLRSVVYNPVSKSLSDLLHDEEHTGDDEEETFEPFPRLQTFSGAIEYNVSHSRDNYYNIEGLKGKIYDGPGLTVQEIRKRFSKKSRSQVRRSVSNPNFLSIMRRDQLNTAYKTASIVTNQRHSKLSESLRNLLPDALKKHRGKDSGHKGSHSELSKDSASPKHSRSSSQVSSTHNSPSNSLTRKQKGAPREDIVASTTVKGINITKKSRSFRRQRPHNGERLHHTNENQGTDKSGMDIKDNENTNHLSGKYNVGKVSERICLEHVPSQYAKKTERSANSSSVEEVSNNKMMEDSASHNKTANSASKCAETVATDFAKGLPSEAMCPAVRNAKAPSLAPKPKQKHLRTEESTSSV